MLKTLSTNKLTSHPSFPKILAAYNEQLKENGKVSGLKFYREVVLAEIPGYDQSSWYYFLKRFKTNAGLLPMAIGPIGRTPTTNPVAEGMQELQKTLLSNSEATQRAIATSLNISVEALQEISDNPLLLSAEKRAELYLKVMKAQDSRVKAIGTIRADNRDQERFDRAMDSSAYG